MQNAVQVLHVLLEHRQVCDVLAVQTRDGLNDRVVRGLE